MIHKDGDNPYKFPVQPDDRLKHPEYATDEEILAALNEQPSEHFEADSVKSLLDQAPLPGALNSPAIFVALLCLVSGLYWWSDWSGALVASKAEVLKMDRPWLLLTGIFAHSNIAHLTSNSGLFLVFAWLLRAYIGSIAFPWLAILAGLLTQLISLLSYHDRVVLIGASGMVYAMAGMWLSYYLFCENRLTVGRKIFRILGFSLIVLLPTQIQEHVSYRAHAIGFVVGGIISLVSMPIVKKSLHSRLERERHKRAMDSTKQRSFQV